MTTQRGFTLAELLVSLAVLGTILAGIAVLQEQGQFSYLMGAARVEAQQNARFALDLMTRELRAAQSITTATGCDGSTGTQDITFADQDGSSTRYRLNGTNLERTKASTTEVLVAGVQSLSFKCYAADGSATATAADIRSIVIAIQTRPEDDPAYTPSRQAMVAESRVRLRNML